MRFILIILVAFSPLTAQQIQLTDWNTLSSLRTAKDAAADSDGLIWVATSGGVFSHNPTLGENVEYRNISALQTLDARSILCDDRTQTVVVGGGDGALDILNPDGSWSNISDIIRASQYPKRGITDLVENEGVLYIATEFGFAVFDMDKRIFVETVDRIGTIQEKTRANGIAIMNDSIWVATDSGLAVASLDEETLRPPGIWRILDTNQGLFSNTVPFIATDGNELAVGMFHSVLVWDGARFNSVLGTPEPVEQIAYQGSTITASMKFGVISEDGTLDVPWSGQLTGHAAVTVDDSPVIVAFVENNAIQVWDNSTLTSVLPNSPLSNQFAKIAIDNSGSLWVATDVDPPNTGQGVSLFDGAKWTNVNLSNTPDLGSNACYRVSSLSDGTVLIGTWGGGALRASYADGELTTKSITSSNSALQGIPNDDNYSLVADAMSDRSGNVWLVNEQSATQLLVALRPDGTSEGFSNCFNDRDNLYRAMAVDNVGNKWVGSFNGAGLLAFNEKDPENRADDICQVIRSSNTQLPDNVISILRIDKVGALWIGTSRGLAVIAGPTGVSNTSIPFVRRVTAISSVPVNDIYVDALNYKWVATTGGVFVLNEDGTEVLATITKSNAPLLEDNIRCVAVDDRTGIAFFGTSQGCSVARSSSIKPASTFSLKFQPQPFSQSEDSELLIDGLAADADLRIMTVGGFMVRAMQTRGRQALWDGKDTQGRLVPPGVYIVQTTSASTNESSVGKIVVKR